MRNLFFTCASRQTPDWPQHAVCHASRPPKRLPAPLGNSLPCSHGPLRPQHSVFKGRSSLPFARPQNHHALSSCSFHPLPFSWPRLFHGVSKLADGIFLQGFKNPLRFSPLPNPFCCQNASMEFRSCQIAPFSTASKAPPALLRLPHPFLSLSCFMPLLAKWCFCGAAKSPSIGWVGGPRASAHSIYRYLNFKFISYKKSSACPPVQSNQTVNPRI